MRTGRRIRSAPSLAGLISALLVMLVCAQSAFGTFTHIATGGPLSVSSATVSAPTKLTSIQEGCKVGKSTEVIIVILYWTASAQATSYAVERASASAGPYTVIGTTKSGVLSYSDSLTIPSPTTYYYRVAALAGTWSKTSATLTVKTERVGSC